MILWYLGKISLVLNTGPEKWLFKLWGYGINGELWSLIRAYLTNRTQCVSINGQTSTISSVVLWNSPRKPTGSTVIHLHIWYVDNINHQDHHYIHPYRDDHHWQHVDYHQHYFKQQEDGDHCSQTYSNDIKLLMVVHDSFDNVSLQDDLNHICVWSNQWDLLLNPAIFISTSVSPPLTWNILLMIIQSPLIRMLRT